MEINKVLFNCNKHEYGDDYQVHLIEQYKLYLEMVDRISSRRLISNSFFLSINIALITLLGYTELKIITDVPFSFILLVSLCGMFICLIWYRLIRSYKDLNNGKFKVIHHIERKLPMRLYEAEWISLGEGKNKKLYLPFTNIETTIPWLLFVFYLFIILLFFTCKESNLISSIKNFPKL